MAWAKNGTPSTLTGAADVITISDLTAKTFNIVLSNSSGSGGAVQWKKRLGYTSIDTGSNYATRYSTNGGADSTETSQASIYQMNSGAGVHGMFDVGYIINISGQEKLMIIHVMWAGSSGAGNAPERNEIVGKWVNTTNQFNHVQTVNVNAGDFDTGSNISALGTTGNEVLYKIQNGTVFEETDTNKSFIFNSSTSTWTQI